MRRSRELLFSRMPAPCRVPCPYSWIAKALLSSRAMASTVGTSFRPLCSGIARNRCQQHMWGSKHYRDAKGERLKLFNALKRLAAAVRHWRQCCLPRAHAHAPLLLLPSNLLQQKHCRHPVAALGPAKRQALCWQHQQRQQVRQGGSPATAVGAHCAVLAAVQQEPVQLGQPLLHSMRCCASQAMAAACFAH